MSIEQIEKLELKIAKFLRYGVIFAGILMFAGWISQIKWKGDPFFNFQMYDQIALKDLILHYYVHQNWGMLVAYSGLLTLIALPVIRVLLTAILFLSQKEKILALVATIVFIGLIVSMTLGIEL
jgi:uncharacterized membrane protein